MGNARFSHHSSSLSRRRPSTCMYYPIALLASSLLPHISHSLLFTLALPLPLIIYLQILHLFQPGDLIDCAGYRASRMFVKMGDVVSFILAFPLPSLFLPPSFPLPSPFLSLPFLFLSSCLPLPSLSFSSFSVTPSSLRLLKGRGRGQQVTQRIPRQSRRRRKKEQKRKRKRKRKKKKRKKKERS